MRQRQARCQTMIRYSSTKLKCAGGSLHEAGYRSRADAGCPLVVSTLAMTKGATAADD